MTLKEAYKAVQLDRAALFARCYREALKEVEGEMTPSLPDGRWSGCQAIYGRSVARERALKRLEASEVASA